MKILLEPIINDAEGLDPQRVAQGMKKEAQQVKDQSVFTEIDGNTMTPEQQANIIESRWVLKKHNEVRARIVAKGYTEPVIDHDLRFASTPFSCILRILLTTALVYNWSVGDVSVAFLHAAAISYNLVMRPPHEFYNEENRHTMWRLNKAVYGLRSSSKQRQDNIAHILTVTLELVRRTTENNVCRPSKDCQVYIMMYVDDLLFIGVQSIINTLFSRMQKGVLTVGSTMHSLAGNISRKGDYIDTSLNNNYVDIMLEESGMTTCNPAPSPGVSRVKGAAEDEATLDHEQRKQYRRLAGKIQWLAHTHTTSGAKELARSLQAPTQLDNKKLKHMIRYLKGTRCMRQPATKNTHSGQANSTQH